MIKGKNRECLVCIRSEQISPEGERQTMETRSKGQLSERDGVLYVLYTEKQEGGPEESGVKNLLKIEDNPPRVSLRKSGAVSWKMNFAEGGRDRAEYQTPYGTLEISARTESVKVERGQKKSSLQLTYALFIQGEKQADCRLEIEIL